MINVKIEANSKFLEKYTTLSDIAILTRKMAEVDNQIKDITKFTIKNLIPDFKYAMFYGAKKGRHMYLVGTQDEDAALGLEKLIKDNKITDVVYNREDLWFKEYQYGYIYEIVPSFMPSISSYTHNRTLLENYIFKSGKFYFVNPLEKQISIPLKEFSPIEHQLKLEKQGKGGEITWLGWVEIKDVGGGNILLCKNHFDIIFPEFLNDYNILYKIFPRFWQYIVKDIYISVHNIHKATLGLEMIEQTINEIYTCKFRELIYNSYTRGADIKDDEFFFTTLGIAT